VMRDERGDKMGKKVVVGREKSPGNMLIAK
jgi:hypothetical protein